MGAGVQSGWPTFTDGPSGTAPAASDCNRWSADINALSGRPKGRWLRVDTTLISDGSWHECRVGTAQVDFDAQGGYMQPTAHSAPGTWVDTFNVNTTGFYLILCRERYSSLANGEHGMQWLIVGGSILCQTFQTAVPLHVQTNVCWTLHPLTAGQQIQCQHSFNGFGDTRDLTLYSNSPTPEIAICMLGETSIHI